ncbi:hypothetical protein UlMin_039244 [Ulmus minor]
MATVSRSPSALPVQLHRNRTSIFLNRSTWNWNCVLHSLSSCRAPRVYVLKMASSEGGRATDSADSYAPSLLRKPPVISQPEDNKEEEEEARRWVNWEDQILEETVPLVGFVRMVLHSGKYKNGEKLTPEHQKIILERLLPYHPEYETKIGCGVESIMVGYHPDFEETRCMFIVGKDGQLIDFSYWKCIKGLIRKKYPLFADGFIFKHFRRRRRNIKI